MTGYKVYVLFDGYSTIQGNIQTANCTCSLITGPKNVIVDTMTPWDGARLLEALDHHNLKCEDVNYVVSTHGHADHVGNNNLFLNGMHVMGHSIFKHNTFYDHNFEEKPHYYIDNDNVSVFASPGHTLDHVSVRVKSEDMGVVIIAGDLFEKEDDVFDAEIWKAAGSEAPSLQVLHRKKVLLEAAYIIPGHGPMFKVTDEMRQTVNE
ncbi:hypothetical protein PR048_015304 [Dryococelus australis]|uniref:Metallo-beta-lactamase domain-containing protein 1 n=1 Tax=Dryococelus australis TaxID=614101 RepID=A0ABQ9HGR4_9NEOP|nr:hypothetical protein PR048_015304 [Dryococelus australis]